MSAQQPESRERTADFTALTAVTQAAGQTVQLAFAAAMWAFAAIDAK